MKLIKDPKDQKTREIVDSLLLNTSRQYTESAHAEIFARLTQTIENFNDKADKSQRFMMYLAVSQVMLAVAQVALAIVQFRR